MQCPGGFVCLELVALAKCIGAHGGEGKESVPHGAEFSKQIKELLWSDVEAVHMVRAYLGYGDGRMGIITSNSSRRELYIRGIKSAKIECIKRCAPYRIEEQRLEGGRMVAYRLTSGASFPPRLIVWRRATGKRDWLLLLLLLLLRAVSAEGERVCGLTVVILK